MRNRAKCRVCKETVESLSRYDYVTCKCGEISICGGADELLAFSVDSEFKHFLRVDEDGNEVVVHYHEKKEEKGNDDPPADNPESITTGELKDALDGMIKSYENLPQNALVQPVTHYDLLSLMILLAEIFKRLDRRD